MSTSGVSWPAQNHWNDEWDGAKRITITREIHSFPPRSRLGPSFEANEWSFLANRPYMNER